MNKQETQISSSHLIFIFLAGIIAGGLFLYAIFYISQNGFPHFGGANSGVKNGAAVNVPYQNVPQMVNNRVAVSGFVIIANNSGNICGSQGWSNCEVWFSNDPFNNGIGKYQVKITIGSGKDSITSSGDLFDHNGSLLPIVHTDQFSWYHVMVAGSVEQCQVDKCVIDVDTITAVQ